MKSAIFFLMSCFFIYQAGTALSENMDKIKLPKPVLQSDFSVEKAISERRSIRSFSSKHISLQDVSQILWSAQGITDNKGLRAAPSAGALYPLKIYLARDDGAYLYIPRTHELIRVSDKNLKKDIADAAWAQNFIKEAPVNIIIAAVYEKVTSRYGLRGRRYTDMEAGHAAQNIHLQAVALGLASVPVGAFRDGRVENILGLKKDEKPLYIIPIGYKK